MQAIIEIFFGTAFCICIVVLCFTVSGAANEIVDALNNIDDAIRDFDTTYQIEHVGGSVPGYADEPDEENRTTVMCAGCGRSVALDADGFTPMPHNCAALSDKFENYFHSDVDINEDNA